jgi:hypothetical protein
MNLSIQEIDQLRFCYDRKLRPTPFIISDKMYLNPSNAFKLILERVEFFGIIRRIQYDNIYDV